MRNHQFRFAYFTPKYEETLAFYREGLELPVIEAWAVHLTIGGRSLALLAV